MSTSAPCSTQVRAATGPARMRVRSSTRMPSGPSVALNGSGSLSPIFSIPPLPVAQPCWRRADTRATHHAFDHATARPRGGNRILEVLCIPSADRVGYGIRGVLTSQNIEDAILQVFDAKVWQEPAAIAGCERLSDRIVDVGGARVADGLKLSSIVLPFEKREALERCAGGPDVDGDILTVPASSPRYPQPPRPAPSGSTRLANTVVR